MLSKVVLSLLCVFASSCGEGENPATVTRPVPDNGPFPTNDAPVGVSPSDSGSAERPSPRSIGEATTPVPTTTLISANPSYAPPLFEQLCENASPGSETARTLSALAVLVDRGSVGTALAPRSAGECMRLETKLSAMQRVTLRTKGLVDVAPLIALKSVRYLDLASNSIVDVRPLGELEKIVALNIKNNRVQDTTSLGKLRNLNELSLEGNEIIDVSAVLQLPRLKRLFAANNMLEKLGVPENVSELQEIDLSKNRLSNIAELTGLGKLSIVRATDNLIQTLEMSGSFASLEYLDVARNKISIMTSQISQARLKTFILHQNPIQDLGALTRAHGAAPSPAFPFLQTLILSETLVDDVGSLTSLSHLRYVDLVNSPAAQNGSCPLRWDACQTKPM